MLGSRQSVTRTLVKLLALEAGKGAGFVHLYFARGVERDNMSMQTHMTGTVGMAHYSNTN